MPLEEQRRAHLAERLADAIGLEATATMFDVLPQAEHIDQRFDAVDGRLDAVEARLDSFERRVDHRFDLVNERFKLLDERFAEFDVKLDALRHELLAAFRGELVSAVAAQTRTLIIAVTTLLFGIAGLSLTLARLG